MTPELAALKRALPGVELTFSYMADKLKRMKIRWDVDKRRRFRYNKNRFRRVFDLNPQ